MQSDSRQFTREEEQTSSLYSIKLMAKAILSLVTHSTTRKAQVIQILKYINFRRELPKEIERK